MSLCSQLGSRGSLSRGVSVQGSFCPGGLCQGGGTEVSVSACITGHMTRGVSVQGAVCPGGGVSVQWFFVKGGLCLGGLCPEGLCPGASLSGRPPTYSNERAVRILLECILVCSGFIVITETTLNEN